MRAKVFALAICAVTASTATAGDTATVLARAKDFGRVSAAHIFCGLTHDTSKLRGLYASAADDNRFMGWLMQYEREARTRQTAMNAGEREKHCEEIRALVGQLEALAAAAEVPAYPDSAEFAEQLATILASEKLCGFNYRADAVQAFIARNVAEDDLAFPQMLSDQINLREVLDQSIDGSKKAARCAQVTRVARSFRFID